MGNILDKTKNSELRENKPIRLLKIKGSKRKSNMLTREMRINQAYSKGFFGLMSKYISLQQRNYVKI